MINIFWNFFIVWMNFYQRQHNHSDLSNFIWIVEEMKIVKEQQHIIKLFCFGIMISEKYNILSGTNLEYNKALRNEGVKWITISTHKITASINYAILLHSANPRIRRRERSGIGISGIQIYFILRDSTRIINQEISVDSREFGDHIQFILRDLLDNLMENV